MSDEVRASHLLVKHQGSRRPASWRDPDGQYIPKKTKEAARDELLAYREQIASGVVTFADLAAKVSDCSSAKHGGDLGFFGPGKMQKAFEVRRDAENAAWRPPVRRALSFRGFSNVLLSVGTSRRCFSRIAFGFVRERER